MKPDTTKKVISLLLALSMTLPQVAAAAELEISGQDAEQIPALELTQAAEAVQEPAELIQPAQEETAGSEAEAYRRDFTDDAEFNYQNSTFVALNQDAEITVADGMLKLNNFKTGRFLDADSPKAADGVLTVRFKSDVDVERFGFFVRTNNNTDERVIIAYDPANGDVPAGWTWRGINGGEGMLCETEAPKAGQWYVLKLTYSGASLELEITDETAGTSAKGQATMPEGKYFAGEGQIGIAHWGYTTKNIEIDYINWEPYEAGEIPETPEADSVEITVDSELTVGETVQATAKVLPEGADQTVTWGIQAGGEAYVSVTPDGQITGVAEGTATLTATTPNGKTAEAEITVVPAAEVPVYHRTFDENDALQEFNYTSVQDNYHGAVIEDGYLKLPEFFGRIVDDDSPLLKNGVMTVRFQVGENDGRYGFFVRTTSASERIMVAYDSGSWKWYGVGSSGDLGSTDALVPNQWYTMKITYVDNNLKVLLTDEETGEISVIGKVTMGAAPAGPGHIGYASWWAAKDMIIDEVTVEPYEEPAPPEAPAYAPLTITDGAMSATLDNRFPAVNGYTLDGKHMDAQPSEEFLYQVAINGDNYVVDKVTASADGDTAVYDMEATIAKNVDIPEMGNYETPLKLRTTITVDEESGSLTMSTQVVEEPEGFRIQSFSIPGLKLAAATYEGAGSQTALEGAHVGGGYNSVSDRRYDLANCEYTILRGGANTAVGDTFSALGDTSLSYVFLTNGELAATILNNVVLTNQKNTVNLSREGTATVAAIGSGAWDYRGPKTTEADDANFPPLDTMWSQVILRDDVNGDGSVDWQDAAIGYRNCMEVPYGGDEIKDYFTYIMHNSASKAQSDTNMSTDMMKKFYNLFDGFGQMQLQKGYQAEGHDDSHGDFGGHISERIGGVEGFRELLAAGDKYNTKVGVHINITEMMLDSFYLDNDIFKRNAATGNLSVNWQWYDPAFYVDEDKDLLSGGLRERLAQLAADTTLEGEDHSSLDWIYVDIYGRSDWHSARVAEIFEDFGWWTATEFSGPFAQQAIWNHWGTDLYYGSSGQGSRYIRFIRNDTADIFPATDPSSGTLLKGMQQPSPNAWVNKYEIGESITLFYNQNLISKYLQHFPILSWNEENTKITFENGVVSERVKGENGQPDQMRVTRNGKLVASCDIVTKSDGTLDVRADSLVFVPWDPITEDKIYHWNPDGGETTWDLPDTWTGLDTVYLYQTTEQGKTFIGALNVEDGKVTIDAQAETPYVVYKTQEEAETMVPAATDWSENSEIKDTGFDAQVFVDQDSAAGRWERSSENGTVDHIGFEKDVRWNNLLVVNSDEDAVISQKITGLEPGKDYAISVWALVENDDNRKVTLAAVNSDGTSVESYLTKTDVLAVKNKFQNTYFRRMRVILEADETGTATVYLKVADGTNPDSKVKFDDVRIWEHVTDTPQNGHYYFDDFENVDFSLGALEHDSLTNDNVHLANEHPDFNNGAPQYLSYVIDGQYSGKINDTATAVGGSLLRTHPSVLRFQPNSTYRVGITYYTPVDGAYKLVAKNDDGEVLAELPLPKNGEVYALGEDGKQTDPAKRKPVGTEVSFTFSTGDDENCYISLVKTGETKDRSTSYLIIDNFVVDDMSPGDKTELATLVAELEKLDLSGYTAESRAAFEEALTAAKAVLAQEDATSADLYAAQKALEEARDGLIEISGGETEPGVPTNTVTVSDAANGTVTVSPKVAAKGDTVTIALTPDEGYELDSLKAADAEGNELTLTDNGDGKYIFTMPGSRVTVTAVFTDADGEPEKGYTDVPDGEWYAEAVQYVTERGLMNGTSETTFSPMLSMSRSMLVTVLYRLAGEPEAGECPFTDVPDGTWYTDAVAWAAANGIVTGVSETTFAPDAAITRESLAVILYRYADVKEQTQGEKGDLSAFADGASVSDWAVDAMAWAVGEGILNGKGGSTLDPQGTATRAEVTAMLMRFCKMAEK